MWKVPEILGRGFEVVRELFEIFKFFVKIYSAE